MPFIVATYVYASSQGQREHSARTKIIWEYNRWPFVDLVKGVVQLGLSQNYGLWVFPVPEHFSFLFLIKILNWYYWEREKMHLGLF